MEKFVIIDGNNIMYRSFYALPKLTNFDGTISNAVFGFSRILIKVISEIKPKYIAVCFDSGKKNFRHGMYDEYKGNRKAMPEELAPQFPMLKEVLQAMDIKVVEQQGLEADDLIGCLSKQFADTENIILTADRDCLQLISDNVKIMQPQKGINETLLVDKKVLKEVYGLTPSQVIDFKALCGDSGDNIPGVKGVGEKTALNLLNNYSTLDGVYENIDKITGKTKDKLMEDKEMAYLSYKLATIVTDQNIKEDIESFTYSFPFKMDVMELFKKYQFTSLTKKTELFEEELEKSPKIDVEIVDISSEEQLSDLAKKLNCFSMQVEENELRLSDGEKEYKVSLKTDLLAEGIDTEKVFEILKDVLEDEKKEKILFDYKASKHYFRNIGIDLKGCIFDILVARYVVNSNAITNVKIHHVLDENLLDMQACAFNMFLIKDKYLAKMKEYGTQSIFYDMEMPLIDTLFDMECEGVRIDKAELDRMEEKYRREQDSLVKQIYELVGHEFKINSPKQLGEVLFDELGIKSYNNKKKSTSAQILLEIEDKHPIVPLIINYRKVNKLYSTYILAYEQLLDKNNKIYTVFNQTLTTTGRLSSSEPNLQNIPVRSEEGKHIRKLFIPSRDDGYIVDADYNQIELRLLASFCGDERLINAYNNGDDIHAITASEMFNVPLPFVTDVLRRQAKAINFGIVYGISDYGLGQNIGITRAEANEYIKRYNEKYPKIAEYMKDNVEFCKEHGFVKTMYGRVRFIPEIKSSQYMQRMFGERAAMNMPLQGTASDIIKLAMIKVHDELKRRNMKSRLILQVHDELIVDATKEEVNEVEKILVESMENVVKLKVKLLVSSSVGKNWMEAH